MKTLQIAYTDDRTGVSHPNAFHTVKSWCYGSDGIFKVGMQVHHDQSCYEAGKQAVVYPDYEFTPETTNVGQTDSYALGLVQAHADYEGATEITI